MLEGIALVLSTGIGRTELPAQLGHGSGRTCWRRVHEWQQAGVLDQLHRAVLDRWGEQGRWTGRGPARTRSASGRAKRRAH